MSVVVIFIVGAKNDIKFHDSRTEMNVNQSAQMPLKKWNVIYRIKIDVYTLLNKLNTLRFEFEPGWLLRCFRC